MCQGLFVTMKKKKWRKEMKRVELGKNMIAYQHDGKSDTQLGYNNYVFIHDHKALLLDTAYSEHLKLVVEDLKKFDIEVVAVLPSHYHPDHFEGLSILANVDVYGTEESLETMKAFQLTDEETKLYGPNKMIKDNDNLKFGDFEFKFELVGGHSECSMLITINDAYLHIGDTYMTLNSGVHSLPYVTWKGLKKHLQAIKHLYDFESYQVLISHGILHQSLSQMDSGIKDRINYLTSLLESNNQATIDQALENCENTFINQEWRQYVK